MSLRKHQAITMLAALMAILCFTSSAEAANIKLSNKSASEIHAVYISDSGTNDWEENVLEGYYLPSGNEVTIENPNNYAFFDLRVEDNNGNYEDYEKFPGKTKHITLYGGGESEYR